MHFSAIPALLAVALTITTTHAVSLIDALNAAGATRFATFIQSDPSILAAYTSPATRTVFAPTDPYFIQPLSRRDTSPQKNALYQTTNQETNLQTLSFVPSGSVVTTELKSDQLSGANQASVSRKELTGNSTSKRQVGTGVTMASGLGGSVSILTGDIPYDGGLIHTVSGMFTLPQPISTTLTTAGLSLFNNLLVQAGLSSTLDGSSSVTVFVPSNAALAAASNAGGSAFLQGHIIPSFVGYLPLLTNGAVFTTQSGTTLKISITDGEFFVNGIQIITPNNIVGNGVVHVINGVLGAPSSSSSSVSSSTTTATRVATVASVATASSSSVATVVTVATSTKSTSAATVTSTALATFTGAAWIGKANSVVAALGAAGFALLMA